MLGSKKEQNLKQLWQLLKVQGLLSAQEIIKSLDISQPTLSRLLTESPDILRIGEGRSRIYALTRRNERIPLVEIDHRGEAHALGELCLLEPRGSIFIPTQESKLKFRIFEDIPFFVWDMRPQGYLGKIFISQHPELNLPERWEDWNETDLYKTLQLEGDDFVGNLILGSESFRKFQSKVLIEIPKSRRSAEYPKMASETLKGTLVGSSVGGEHPKFSVAMGGGNSVSHALVKFSPPMDTDLGRRWADLLIAEDIALKLLKEAHVAAADSEYLESKGIAFLEVIRFDRIGRKGRKGVVSLGAVDDEFIGQRKSWTHTALGLQAKKIISADDARKIIFLDCFGACIANSDRHFGNLSLFWKFGSTQMSLAPVYDMLPMAYAPVQGNLVDRSFEIPLRTFEQINIWESAKKMAVTFWKKLSCDQRVSEAFRKIAEQNVASLEKT